MAISNISQARDKFKQPLNGMIQQSGYINNIVLAANTGQNFALPANPQTLNPNEQLICVIAVSGGSDLYILFSNSSGNISVPSANATNGSGVELVSSCVRACRKSDTYVALVSPSNCIVSMAWYIAEVRA